jgi:chromosome segregation ATPase
MDEIAEPQFTPLERELRYRNAQLRRTCGTQGRTIHLLRAELAEVRELNSKVERGDLRRYERLVPELREEINSLRQQVEQLEEKLEAKDDANDHMLTRSAAREEQVES